MKEEKMKIKGNVSLGTTCPSQKLKVIPHKLDIDLFGSYNGKTLEDMYNERRNKFIAESERYIKGYSTGFFGYRDGYYEKTPQVGEAEWNKKYPKGIETFKENFMTLNSVGQQNIINKINEIIEFLKN